MYTLQKIYEPCLTAEGWSPPPTVTDHLSLLKHQQSLNPIQKKNMLVENMDKNGAIQRNLGNQYD